MEMKIPRDTLLGPLSKVVPLVGTRSVMPILSNVLIEFGPETRVTATNIETTVIAKINHSADATRAVLMPGEKLYEILKLMDPAEVNFDLLDNKVVLAQGSSEFTLVLTSNLEGFPNVEMKDSLIGSFRTKSADFLKAISKVAFAVSHDETRYILTGAYIEGKDGIITTVGTDGFRMAVHSMSAEEKTENFGGQVVPKKALGVATGIIASAAEVTVNVYETNIGIVTDTFTFYTRKIEGSFPNYSDVIPHANGRSAIINREALLKALRKVSAIGTKADLIDVRFAKDRLLLKLESDIGVAKEPVEAQVNVEEEVSSYFNLRLLTEALSSIDEESVTIHIPHAYGAYLFVPAGNDSYKNIVMPVRV